MTDDELDLLADKVAAKVLHRITGKDSLPELLSTKDACKVLGIGRRKILDLIAQGKISLASGPGQKYRFYKSQILNLVTA